MTPKKEPQEFLISLSDYIKIFKKRKILFFVSTAFFSIGLGIYSLTKPIQYLGEASFKEKGDHQGIATAPSLAMILSGISGKEKSAARTILRSRSFLEKLIVPLDLQASLIKASPGSLWFKTIQENLKVEYSYLRGQQTLPLPDLSPSLRVEKVRFHEEIPLTLKIIFIDEKNYFVSNGHQESLGKGILGKPFSHPLFSFTLVLKEEARLEGETYFLTLSPLAEIAKALNGQIRIESSKEDPSLLKLSYHHRDRHIASSFLNHLMFYYQQYLKEEQQRLSLEQIAYLYRREEEMGINLKKIADAFADQLSEEVSHVGFPDSEKAMQFLVSQMHQYQNKMLQINLELKMHQKMQERASPFDSPFPHSYFPKKLHPISLEIQALRQQRDNIELALRTSLGPMQQEKWHNHFSQQVEELEEIRHCSEDAKILLASLMPKQFEKLVSDSSESSINSMSEVDSIVQYGVDFERSNPEALAKPESQLFNLFGYNHSDSTLPSLRLLENPKYGVGVWYNYLLNNENILANASFKDQFASYLNHLIRFLDMCEKTIQERLSHQQTSSNEFQGIDLEVAQQLYMEQNKQLNELEASSIQLQFMAERIQYPDFELSSLGTVIKDPITNKLIEKASEYLLAIQDDANRGIKEKERFRQELLTHKKFLGIHIDQTIQLLDLQKKLTQDKIYSLQQATLGLIQKKLSILESQLSEGNDFHIKSLEHEKELIEQYEKEIRTEMAKLPRKWVSEKLFEHQVGVNKSMVEELTKLVETKNIASNLESVQSAPLDEALPPIKPLRPRILFFAALGGILGAFFSGAGLLIHAIYSGISVSRENLELAGMHVSGNLDADPKNCLATKRHLLAYLDPISSKHKDKGQTLVCMREKRSFYPKEIATLLSRKGEKVLLFELDQEEKENNKRENPTPSILLGSERNELFDTLIFEGDLKKFGGTIEWVSSKWFQKEFAKFMDQYDWIVVEALVKPSDVEAGILFHLFDHAAFFVSKEKICDLRKTIESIKELKEREERKKASFIFEVHEPVN